MHATQSVAICRTYARSTAMRPNNTTDRNNNKSGQRTVTKGRIAEGFLRAKI